MPAPSDDGAGVEHDAGANLGCGMHETSGCDAGLAQDRPGPQRLRVQPSEQLGVSQVRVPDNDGDSAGRDHVGEALGNDACTRQGGTQRFRIARMIHVSHMPGLGCLQARSTT